MRLFVAVALTDEMKSEIMKMMHGLKKQGVRGNYTPLQNLHLTLAFIGEVQDAAAVKAALSEVKVKKFRLSLTEPGTFGDLLWIGLKGNQALSAAVKSVREALDAAGIPYDRKKYVPHITVVRKMNGNWKKVPAPKGEMTAARISLMKSEEKNGKRVYTEIYHIGE